MRIAALAYHSSPLGAPGSGDAGGMTVYITQLAKALTARGVGIDIYTRSDRSTRQVTHLARDARVVALPAGPERPVPKHELPRYIEEFTERIRAFAAAQRVRYDCVHSHYWQSGLAGIDLARGWAIPLVHSHHTLGLVKNQHLAAGDDPEPEDRLLGEKHVMAEADILVASTEEEQRQLFCLYRVPHDRVTTIHPGVDHLTFHPGSRTEARRRLGLPDRPLVLYVGRIQPLKGVDLAVRAVAELNHRGAHEVDLLVVGGPSGNRGMEEMERLDRLVHQLEVSDRVRFAGPQPHASLPDLYRAANVVAVCSHYESFGFAALEAHACGTPVVASAVGGLAHIVRDRSSGTLIHSREPVEFADGLARFLFDERAAVEARAAAAASARRFSWTHTAAELHELYVCLAGEHPELCTC